MPPADAKDAGWIHLLGNSPMSFRDIDPMTALMIATLVLICAGVAFTEIKSRAHEGRDDESN